VPNQKTWMKMAAQMGIKGAAWLPDEHGLTSTALVSLRASAATFIVTHMLEASDWVSGSILTCFPPWQLRMHVRACAPSSTASAPTAVLMRDSNSQPTLIATNRLHNIFTLLCCIAYLIIYDLSKSLIKTFFMVYDDK
jgi:hypothetical protein